MRKLTRQVVLAQEEERKRLSRDLHDELGQTMAVLKMSLQLIERD
jgi:signal transduction histidine kinase